MKLPAYYDGMVDIFADKKYAEKSVQHRSSLQENGADKAN